MPATALAFLKIRTGPLDRGRLTTMSALVVTLLIWDIDTTPSLWVEVESLLDPWANVTLTCRAYEGSLGFQLFKDGVALEPVNLLALEHRFVLGAVTSETRGIYRCRTGIDNRWTQLSNLVEVSGTESLAPPSLSAKPVSWITPGLSTTLVCRGVLRGVTFLLRREGDDEFLEVSEAPKDVEATFLVHQAGNYSCSYRLHDTGKPSESSTAVSVEELEAPPPPALSVKERAAAVQLPGDHSVCFCVAPVIPVEFQLRRGEVELRVDMYSSNPGTINFNMGSLTPTDSGLYTCRYRMQDEHRTWSKDSVPVELLLSDGTLPAPKLQAEPSANPTRGALVRLRCQAPRSGLRFALERSDAQGHRVQDLLSPEGSVAVFELRDVSVLDSGNYSCVYVDPAPPFAGSARSAPLELSVDGPPPKPQLQPLWQGAVTSGQDAVLRCKGPLSDFSFELVRDGEVVVSSYGQDLVLINVSPQHAGNYSCRYHTWRPKSLLSELSDPVELRVTGKIPLVLGAGGHPGAQ
ncbi:PREDICTED: alpha-1B-glycoprotein [Chrysochloris asiatica]|uniref:Alpha-1B-glycoprotein n=1 Tax=Chrysochloris asiatica TaxID=185453 RepID=A0A9B0X0Y4_CHRAS|nr:PREDICTED: alpha-1B-glycoprotein [Chrysochloris asiatica]